jgi:hypothetical protein
MQIFARRGAYKNVTGKQGWSMFDLVNTRHENNTERQGGHMKGMEKKEKWEW